MESVSKRVLRNVSHFSSNPFAVFLTPFLSKIIFGIFRLSYGLASFRAVKTSFPIALARNWSQCSCLAFLIA